MKPTPTKLALLMSAAGLGLPGLAQAGNEQPLLASSAAVQAWDAHDQPTVIALEAPAPCTAAGEAEWSLPAFQAYCAGLGTAAERPREAQAVRPHIVLVLATPPEATHADVPSSHDAHGTEPPRSDSAEQEAAELADALAMIHLADPPPPSSARAMARAPAPTAVPSAGAPMLAAAVADVDHRVAPATTDANGPERPAESTANPVEPSSTELVLRNLADFVDTGYGAIAYAADATETPATTWEFEFPQVASAAISAVEPPPVWSAETDVALVSRARAAERADAAGQIVVVPNADRVLMSLAALLASDRPTASRLGAQTQATLVATHSEKVLETLAVFRPGRTQRPDRSRTCVLVESTTQELPPRATHDVALPTPPAPSVAASGNPIGIEFVALGADKLDQVRGGFVTDGGLKVSFGIERAVYLNGSLVTTTSLNVADLSKISGGQAQVSTSGPGSLAVVQSGLGNLFQPGSITQTAAGTVIQNTLDNQKIQTITRIDAVVNSSSLMRSINLHSSMRSAVIDSLRR